MKLKLTIDYLGTAFAGWQRQNDVRTVQSELENGLGIYLRAEIKKQGVEVEYNVHTKSSGRTDAGVHARGQVVSLEWPEGLNFDANMFCHSLNGITPPELNILNAEVVPDDFDARSSTHIKEYRYRIALGHGRPGPYQPNVWAIPQPLDIKAMAIAARDFLGQHDFSSFRASDCTTSSTVRTILCSEVVRTANYELVFVTQGKGYLKQMVRTMVGTLVEIGRGKREVNCLPEIIAARNREIAGQTAPAEGLTLEWVRYE